MDGLWSDAEATMPPDHIVEDLARALLTIQSPSYRFYRARCDLVTLTDQLRELVNDGLPQPYLALAAIEGQYVAAQKHITL
jgi:hypothetical protein